MHIAYLIPTLDHIGGAERQLISLATGMARRGWRVTVIALRGDGGHAAQTLSIANVSFLSLEMRKGLLDPRGWSRLRRWINAAKPDIVHAHLAQAALLARGIRMLAPCRVLIDTIHSPAPGTAKRRLAYRLSSSAPDMVTAVSRACAQPWLRARAIRSSELLIIPNGIDIARWKSTRDPANEASRSCCPPSSFRWIAVGRLDPVKDYETLLMAFSMLPLFARLAIAGCGPLENDLRRRVAELGMQDRVEFLGFQEDIRPFLQNSDGFVLTSRWEGLPIALMEASACELPAVFTETSGARELFPFSTLPVVPVGDSAALAVAMKSLMQLPKSRLRELGQTGRQEIVNRFDQQSVLTRFENLYRQLLMMNPYPSRQRRKAESAGQSATCSSEINL
ncbi:MAG: glycosyltransferase [Acidobacteria bacterium]|nr:glycosyltransferase [Acidobacteriota bacterium]